MAEQIPTRLQLKRKRREFEKRHGTLGKAILAALIERQQMMAQGVSAEDCDKGIAAVLKDAIPRGREEPWHHDCETCGDSGWQTVMRHAKVYGEDAPFVIYCSCRHGRRLAMGHAPKEHTPESVTADVAKGW